MKPYHLDNIYRDRWQEYYLADGRKFDSRQIYWRLLEWEKLVQIITHVREKKFLTHCNHIGFQFFVIYRNGGFTWKGNRPVEIHEWAVGWSDGKQCFMTDIDFKTGDVIKNYVIRVSAVKAHIHPRVGGGNIWPIKK